ncbi:MAG: hypothetical protein QM808_10275 [Steroidobacteraceae bacterium]
MSQLFRVFVDIALWRRGPQDLPASKTLAWLVACCYAFASAVQVGMMGWNVRSAILLVMFDLGLQALWLWGLLVFFAKRPRFLQSFTAFLGVGALLTAADVLITTLLGALGVAANNPANPWPLLRLALFLLLLGRILQQTLEQSLFMSMSLTLVILITVQLVSQGLVPGM